jgi:uncharacterized protein HemX
MAETHTPTPWTNRMVPVPVWSLMALGAALAGGGGFLGMASQQAEASSLQVANSANIDKQEAEDIRSTLARIEGRILSIERQVADLKATRAAETPGR